MEVLKAINLIQAELSKVGISKDQQNRQQGFQFRGIDAVYNSLAAFLAAHQLVVLPQVLTRNETVRQTNKGGLIYNVVVEVEYTLYSPKDGSTVSCRLIGEGMDTADKATSKAMSVAYKYWALQTFCIPLSGEPDADHDSHPETKPVDRPEPTPRQEPVHIDRDKLYGQLEHSAHQSMNALGAHWAGLTADERKAIGPAGLKQLKAQAPAQQPQPNTHHSEPTENPYE